MHLNMSTTADLQMWSYYCNNLSADAAHFGANVYWMNGYCENISTGQQGYNPTFDDNMNAQGRQEIQEVK